MDIFQKLEKIEILLTKQTLLSKEFLTLEETADYLDLSKSAIYRMTSKREIPFYNPGGKKLYFKKSDLDQWILQGKTISHIEMEQEVNSYLSRNKKSRL